jgi:uncharacterized protein YoxC
MSDEYFNKTKQAIKELEDSLLELKSASNNSLNQNKELSLKVMHLNNEINKKVDEIEKIITTLSGALE